MQRSRRPKRPTQPDRPRPLQPVSSTRPPSAVHGTACIASSGQTNHAHTKSSALLVTMTPATPHTHGTLQECTNDSVDSIPSVVEPVEPVDPVDKLFEELLCHPDPEIDLHFPAPPYGETGPAGLSIESNNAVRDRLRLLSRCGGGGVLVGTGARAVSAPTTAAMERELNHLIRELDETTRKDENAQKPIPRRTKTAPGPRRMSTVTENSSCSTKKRQTNSSIRTTEQLSGAISQRIRELRNNPDECEQFLRYVDTLRWKRRERERSALVAGQLNIIVSNIKNIREFAPDIRRQKEAEKFSRHWERVERTVHSAIVLTEERIETRIRSIYRRERKIHEDAMERTAQLRLEALQCRQKQWLVFVALASRQKIWEERLKEARRQREEIKIKFAAVRTIQRFWRPVVHRRQLARKRRAARVIERALRRNMLNRRIRRKIASADLIYRLLNDLNNSRAMVRVVNNLRHHIIATQRQARKFLERMRAAISLLTLQWMKHEQKILLDAATAEKKKKQATSGLSRARRHTAPPLSCVDAEIREEILRQDFRTRRKKYVRSYLAWESEMTEYRYQRERELQLAHARSVATGHSINEINPSTIGPDAEPPQCPDMHTLLPLDHLRALILRAKDIQVAREQERDRASASADAE